MIHELSSAAKKSPRAERREVMTDALLDRSMELLEEGGLDALTLQKVAQSLGYVTTAVYRYFPSKDALVAALQRRSIGIVQAHFERELARRMAAADGASPPTRTLAALLAAADIYLGLPQAEPRAWYLVALLLGDPRPLLSEEESRRTLPILAEFLGSVEVLFRDAAREGALEEGPTGERVLGFWAALHGALCLEKARRIVPALPTAASIGRASARSLLSSWGATPARLGHAQRALEKGK